MPHMQFHVAERSLCVSACVKYEDTPEDTSRVTKCVVNLPVRPILYCSLFNLLLTQHKSPLSKIIGNSKRQLKFEKELFALLIN